MRFAIFSDLHANLEATEAVLADAEKNACTHYICLGDVVGYHANPRECLAIVQKLQCPVVKGNHDEQAVLTDPSRRFNPLAETAINWTRSQLAEEEKEWLRQLPLSQRVAGFTIVHASLDQPENWGYVFNTLDAAGSFSRQETTVCFLGHTHVAGAFVRDEDIKRVKVDNLPIEHGKKYIVNVGSVGQPRDGDWRAAYCIYHTDREIVEQRRVPYDLAITQKKIIQAGLPSLLAERLGLGR